MDNKASYYIPGTKPCCPVCIKDLTEDKTGELSGTGIPCYFCPEDLFTMPWDFEKGCPI